jgi:RHS repeat-associated protein
LAFITKIVTLPKENQQAQMTAKTQLYSYFGARYYMSDVSIWLSVDPMKDKYPNISPFNYCHWSPVMLTDPDGRDDGDPSTHTDENGVVVAVFNDKDKGIYKHKGVGETAKTEVLENHSKTNTSANGQKMGETELWDEFMSHNSETGNPISPLGYIQFGSSWDADIEKMNKLANEMGVELTAINSLPNMIFDIKADSYLSPKGTHTGKMLNGKYVTAESAGNYLAGLNGTTATTFYGGHVETQTFLAMAGLLHSFKNGTNILIPPFYGEIPYAGRQILRGVWEGLKRR